MKSAQLNTAFALGTGLWLVGMGCATTPYDSSTDQAVTAIQKRVDAYVSRATTQPTDPAFYGSLSPDLHSLEIRENARLSGRAVDSIKPTTQQVGELEKAVDDLRVVDEGTAVGPARSKAIQDVGANLDRIFESLLHLELARKGS
jgi:hypothetical protein